MLLILGRACIQVRKGEFRCRSVPMNMANQRVHWATKSKWTRAWKDEVQIAIAQNTEPKIKSKKPKVLIKLYQNKLMDYDGAYSSVKPVLDGLTEQGVIEDDGPEYIDLKVEQIQTKIKEQRVEILIT